MLSKLIKRISGVGYKHREDRKIKITLASDGEIRIKSRNKYISYLLYILLLFKPIPEHTLRGVMKTKYMCNCKGCMMTAGKNKEGKLKIRIPYFISKILLLGN